MHTTVLTAGFVAIARPTFDTALAAEVTQQARDSLLAAGLNLIGPETLVLTMAEAQAAVGVLAGQPLDLLILFQATFADSTMASALAAGSDAPLLLWAVPEARTGGRLRLNSLCGINLAGHALTRAGTRYAYIYAGPEDAAAVDKARTLAQAGRVRWLLRQTRIGRVGVNPDGFETCLVNWDGLQAQLGLEVVQVKLDEVFAGARAADEAQVDALVQALSRRVAGLEAVDRVETRGTLAAYLALRDLAEREDLQGLAVRCWPEFFTDLGCSACGAMSMLSDEYLPCSCEADVNGTITQLILQWLSDSPAFGADMVEFDRVDNTAVLWHCGLAPLSMADPAVTPQAAVHSNRQKPLLMAFPLKPGRVTLARLSEASGEFRLVIGGGEMLQAPPSFGGTSGVVRFDRSAADVLDTILGEGLEHHISLTYGDHQSALAVLAGLLELPVLHLSDRRGEKEVDGER